MAGWGGLSAYDALDLAYAIVAAGINFAVLGWMFVNLNRVLTANGSLDLYLNFLGRTMGWQLAAAFAYGLIFALI